MSAQRVGNLVTSDEYLTIDRAAEVRSEFFSGEMVAMAGASDRHELVVFNLCAMLAANLRGKDCAARPSNLRVRVNSTNYVFPDVTVTCGERRFLDGQFDTLLNPTVVFEILSDSTSHKDRGLKWHLYRLIDSLQHYVIIDQHKPYVEVCTRQPDGDWLVHTEEFIDGTVNLPAIDVALPMSGIYENFETARVHRTE